MNGDEAIRLAKRDHLAGRLAEAEKIYRQVLQTQPNHSEALYLLGTLAGQRGDEDAAADLIRRAIAARPDYADAHRNLGVLLAKRGRYDEALASFSKAAHFRPDIAQNRLDIANIYAIQNQPDKAIPEYQKAITLDPNLPAALIGLGDALARKGAVDEALSAYNRAAQLNPNIAEIHHAMGLLLFKKGRFEEAVATHLAAVRLKPDFALAHFHLGHAHRAMGSHRTEETLAAYRQAVKLKPDLLEALVSMAVVLAQARQFDEAQQCHARAAAIQPNSALVHEAMGAIKLQQTGAADAEEHFRRAVSIDPNYASGWNSLGLALQSLGRFDEAADCYKRMLEIRPDAILAQSQLSRLSRQRVTQQEIQSLLETLQQPDLTAENRINAEFAVAAALDDAERFEEAFEHIARANSLAKQEKASSGDRYDPREFSTLVDRTIKIYTAGFFEKRRGWGDPSELPVFVVGMPRSGTTLVHQIAASHPRVYGAGELNDISRILQSLTKPDGTISTSSWTAESITDLSRRHLEHLQSLGPGALRVVDKMPGNLHHLGLIALLFPAARVVLCRRDPRDTCLSCYFQNFAQANTFSLDLADCGHFHVHNDRLMAHWLKVLPLAMLEVQYENVVADLEGQSRRLIEFLGLPWDPACLEFYRAQTTVLTSSIWQVRQPIYQRSVGRWRHYERQLGSLLNSLGYPC